MKHLKHLKAFEQNEWYNIEWVPAVDVKPGMLAYLPNKDKAFEVIEIYKTSYLKKNPELYSELIDKDQSHSIGRYATKQSRIENLKYLSNGWLVLLKDLEKNQMILDWYEENRENMTYDTVKGVRVPMSEIWKTTSLVNLPYSNQWLEVDAKEGWKKSKNLMSANNKIGVIE